MVDLALQFGGDISIGPAGDIAVIDGPALTQQRVLRRLLTNSDDYIWQLGYGAGLGQFVGQPAAPAAITGVARAQLLQETAIAQTPPLVINTVVGNDGTVTLSLRYANAASGQTDNVSISI